MNVVSLLFHDVYASKPRESGFRSPAADRYKLSVPDFEAQLDGLAAVNVETPWLAHEFATAGESRIPIPASRIPAVITFDDGGESYYTLAAERLEALGWRGRVNLKQARHQKDESPLDARCDCAVCTRFTRAYLHHLIKAEEMLGARLVTQHNLHFYAALTRAGREAIEAGRYATFAEETSRAMRDGDEIGPADPRTSGWKPPRSP